MWQTIQVLYQSNSYQNHVPVMHFSNTLFWYQNLGPIRLMFCSSPETTYGNYVYDSVVAVGIIECHRPKFLATVYSKEIGELGSFATGITRHSASNYIYNAQYT